MVPNSFKNRRLSLLWVLVWLPAVFLWSCVGRIQPPVPPEPAPAPVPELITEIPSIHSTIQVGAFSTPERAARYADVLRRSGLDAYHFIDGDGLYKVRFERFETREQALERAIDLQATGIISDYYIVTLVVSGSGDPSQHLRTSLVQTANRFIGIPYVWGGETTAGFDCSGLTMTVYRLNGLQLPRSAREQFGVGKPVKRDDLKPGDLVFFATTGKGRVSHVGIYNGDGSFIHAPRSGKRIRNASLSNKYFRDRYIGARRYF